MMTYPFPELAIIENPHNAPKVTVIEGPDGAGKTYAINRIKEAFAKTDIELRVLAFPGNRGPNLEFRNMVFSDASRDFPMFQAWVFIADMIYTYEAEIKLYLNDDNVKFVFDRFIVTTALYQNKSPEMLAMMLQDYPEFCEFASTIHYIYLDPQSFDVHKERLLAKSAEKNHLDPETDEQIRRQAKSYHDFAKRHRRSGLLGSTNVSVHIS